MRHRTKKLKIGGREPDHRNALVKNLITSLILHEKIKTTEAKAKAIAPRVERLITKAKSVASGAKLEREIIREFKASLFDENASRKLLEELTKRYSDRTSGFTRITHFKNRPGDAAPVVYIELV
ncbi:MAG: 50S ribosomal protein L17 [Candidatus Gracilibacteria bacterium]